MSEWWTYRLSDFLMFSPATYWRMVERYNHEMWPLQLVMVAVGLTLLWMVAARRPWAGKVVPAVLTVIWAWVGWSFHWERYAQINWAAEYLAWAFGAQAALFIMLAVARKADGTSVVPRANVTGLALAVIGLLLYALIAPAQARPWSQAEVFGLMPEPTALATLGLLIALRAPHTFWWAFIPALSLAAGLLTGWMLRA